LPLESLISPYVGVVRGVQDVLAGPEDLRLATAWCETAYAETVLGAAVAHSGGGSGPSTAEARAAAIGEAVERYSACFVDRDALVVTTARRLGARAVDPSRFALFSARQLRSPGFRYVPFDRDTELAWIEGVALPGGEPAWLPAQLVHLAGHEHEPQIARATSSGLACHASPAAAVESALLELIERDAFMITWKARLTMPLLEWSGNDMLTRFERSFLCPTGLRWRVVNLSAFWDVPCAAAVVRSRAPGTAPLGVGAAAGATIERAVTKALDEAARVRTWADALHRLEQAPPEPADIRDFDDHIRFYADPANAHRAAFLDASAERRHTDRVPALPSADAEARIDAICRRLARRGASAYVVDLTSPDVRDAGLTVKRAVVPELCALDVEHDAPMLGGSRLYDEPFRLGLRRRPLTEDDVNPDPHPFP
jgi:ribosomal protein S12 methylthiotransferase accessory factor